MAIEHGLRSVLVKCYWKCLNFMAQGFVSEIQYSNARNKYLYLVLFRTLN